MYADVVRILKGLVQIDTSFPSGNETAAARFLAQIADDWGFAWEIVEAAPGRGNFILRWPAATEEQSSPLILLSHLDVVPATESGWRHPPFAAIEEEGVIWGRGCLDTKQLTAMGMAALGALKREGYRPKRALYLIATADEETGSRLGLEHLLQVRAELFQGATVINEGGGFALRLSKEDVYLLEIGQKGRVLVTIEASEKADNPFFPRQAGLLQLTRLLGRLNAEPWMTPDTPVTLPDLSFLEAELASLPQLSDLWRTFTHNTWTATGFTFDPGHSTSRLRLDGRLLPGIDQARVEDWLRERLTPLGLSWQSEAFTAGNLNSGGQSLVEELRRQLTKLLPGSRLQPFLSPGGSDARLLRPLGVSVFGFAPVLADDISYDEALKRVHGYNERIAIDSLRFGSRLLYETLRAYDGGAHD